MNNRQEVKNALYVLRQAFGQPVTVRKFLERITDYSTGQTISQYEDVEIYRAVVWDSSTYQHHVYGPAFNAVARELAFGGHFLKTMKNMLIEDRITEKDLVVISEKTYTVGKVRELDDGIGYMVILLAEGEDAT